jgi:transcriptional regulator with XRE-family HTH domain
MKYRNPGNVRGRPGRRHRHWRESLMSIMEPGEEYPSTTQVNVGRRLNELRMAQGLSIRSLAEMSGLNFNTLSLIENEKSSPSVSTLQQLARALRVPITAFFDSAPERRDLVYQKAGSRPMADFPHGSLEDLGHGITLGEGVPLLVTLEPGAGSGPDPIIHTGQEFVFCLEGRLAYTVEGHEYILEAGDSLIFQAALSHRWENTGTHLSRSILILCPSDENDLVAEKHFMPGQVEG